MIKHWIVRSCTGRGQREPNLGLDLPLRETMIIGLETAESSGQPHPGAKTTNGSGDNGTP
jgi:hypothetical protein